MALLRHIFVLTLQVKGYTVLGMQPTAYTATYHRTWINIFGSVGMTLVGATPAFAMVCVYADNDMSLVRQFGMNT